MKKTELVNLLLDNSYRDTLIDSDREYIIYLSPEELKELFAEFRNEYDLLTLTLENGSPIELKPGNTFVLPTIGKFTINEGKEFKLFKLIPIQWLPNIK